MTLIKEFTGQCSLSKRLSVLGVAKSTYYHQLKKDCPLAKYEYLRDVIDKVIRDNPAYGYRRIKVELESRGYLVNHKLLRKLLRAWGLDLNRKRQTKKTSGIIKMLDELADSVNLTRFISKPELFEVVFNDITEITYATGKTYLAACLEAKAKRIIGYQASRHPNAALVISAYRQAIRYLKANRVDLMAVTFHQDQGSVYTGYDYVGNLVKDRVTLSYSRKATPSDNPEVESFFGRLKDECRDEFAQAQTESEVIALINEKISYYNGVRRHSSIGYLAPNAFIANQLKALPVQFKSHSP